MGRTRTHTRRRPRSNPRGVLVVRGGGYGFVQTAEGEFYVPESKMAGAFDGDLVELAPLAPRDGGKRANSRDRARSSERPAARVLRVLDRAHDTLVGRYEVAEPFGVVVPEDPHIPYDVFTMRADRPDIEDGSLVVVRISSFPTRRTAATGVVEEVLGRADDDAVSIDMVVARHKLETAFSDEALAEAAAATLDEAGAFSQGYRDLRDRFVFTVDPSDARDFDDALSLEPYRADAGDADGAGNADAGRRVKESYRSTGVRRTGAGGLRSARWRLGVHIADVSHYVPWGSSLDLNARRRATSVYLADRVIPMLPEALSNELCSLKPNEVRRSMTADLYLDDAGALVAYELYPALVRSNARLAYEQVQRMLDEGASACPAHLEPLAEDIAGRVGELSRLAKARVRARHAAGGLDFETAEARVRLDAEGRPTGVDVRVKTEATSLVEEAMILANETVAAHLRDADFPCLYRVHERPAADALAALVPVLQEFDWFRDIDRARFAAGDPRALQQALAASAGRPEAELVSSLVLRSMKRALYRPACEGHYGLASSAYAHFTSPIRRYPDLVVHRMLRANLTRRPERFDQEVSSLSWIAEHSSEMERVADAAARESQEVKIIEYMGAFVGQTFPAVVSGVTSWGVYVRLENTAEGLVPIRCLGGEYFAFDPALHRLTGQDTGAVFRLGQRLPVVLTAADPRSRRLDFRPARPSKKAKRTARA